MKKNMLVLILAGIIGLIFEPNASAELSKSDAETTRINLLTPNEVLKMKAETAKLQAETAKLYTEAQLNEIRISQGILEMDVIKQRMAIRAYEFQRIVEADHKMNAWIDYLERNLEKVRPLINGQANHKTWAALDAIFVSVGKPEQIKQLMFDTQVEALSKEQFILNDQDMIHPGAFPGGHLGDLYDFVKDNNLWFKKWKKAHESVLKIVDVASKAVEYSLNDFRALNQAIRLTIANISP